MIKFKIMCPECKAIIITASPQSIIWEHCPSCGRHAWDKYDILMAEVYVPGHAEVRNVHPEN